MRAAAALVISFLACVPGWPGAGYGTPRSSDSYPRVTADAAVRPGPRGEPRLEVFAEICYDGLHFQRSGEAYLARLEYALVAYDQKGNQLAGDTWRRDVRVEDYRDTRSNRKCLGETLALPISPTAASAVLSVLDRRTGERSRVELEVRVPPGRDRSWRLSNLVFRRAAPEPPGPPHPTRIYGEEWGDLVADFEIYSGLPGDSLPPDDLAVSYQLEDMEGVKVADGSLEAYSIIAASTGTPAAARYLVRYPVDTLSRGLYTLEVRCRSARFEDGALGMRETFEVSASRAFWIEDYARYVETLSYIASDAEVEPLRAAAPAERRARWEAFWRLRDPSPGTPRNEREDEHLRRVAYAERTFAGLREAGWETDRGRIYIMYGAPDDIERTSSSTGLESVEVWQYYRSRQQFVFRDASGFGDFILEGGGAPR